VLVSCCAPRRQEGARGTYQVHARVARRPLARDVGVDRDGAVGERVLVDVDDEVREGERLAHDVVGRNGREEGRVEGEAGRLEREDGARRRVGKARLARDLVGPEERRGAREGRAEELEHLVVDADQAGPGEAVVALRPGVVDGPVAGPGAGEVALGALVASCREPGVEVCEEREERQRSSSADRGRRAGTHTAT